MTPVRGPGAVSGAAPAPAAPRTAAGGFAGEMSAARSRADTPALHLSEHAARRLAQAGLAPGPEDWEGLRAAVGRAAARGSRQTLVVWDRAALIVAVPQRTVVTAVTAGRMQDHVFTGIDSAVFVPGRV